MVVDILNRITQAKGSIVGRAFVAEINDDGIVVSLKANRSQTFVCDRLDTGGGETETPEIGDEVLVVTDGSSTERGCILGRIRKGGNELSGEDKTTGQAVAKHVEIVADSTLQLKCGKGSISICEDGTIIIKGSRLLSRSQGVNKIKGASVQIN